ncbi:MAG: carboxypeptidase-like regulatory domain-containing protein [Prevotella sp.]|nr:carboxypeptidase-like regulatory domain-containing protein [Candidatus Prevotella equi]
MIFKRHIFVLILSVLTLVANAQIKGVVTDAEFGDGVSFVTVSYKGKHVASVGDVEGQYKIAKHNGWVLTFSAVGYKSKDVKITSSTPDELNIVLQPDSKYLDELTVKSKKSRYSRKENPAVELMRRVIAAKKQTKLENKDYYQYRNYEKLTICLNNVTKEKLDSGSYAKKPWLKDQVEINPKTGKYILPVIVTEKVFRKFYRKDPSKERILVDAEKSSGVNDLIETGDMFTTIAKDVFTEVDIYDNRVKLLKLPFVSPIGDDAISCYRYYIVDTVKVDRDSCIHLTFLPNNQQDIAFRGDLWIINDSSLHVKKAILGIPKRSDVNFVSEMEIEQEYIQLPTGEWVLSNNDMIVEMEIVGNVGKFFINRISRRNDYSFDHIDDKLFRGKALEKRDPYSEMRDTEYWTDNREVSLTKGEEGMDSFIKGIKSTKGFGWLMTGFKAILENYIETTKAGKPSKVDIGPVTSMISSNTIDGLRLRLAAQTTGALNRHFFLKGYVAYGFNSHKFHYDLDRKERKVYYGGTATYSFNKKSYSPDEFPMRNISITSSYDLVSPSDQFLDVDKDNLFAAIKWTSVPSQALCRTHSIDFVDEEDWGFSVKAGLINSTNEAAGRLVCRTMNNWTQNVDGTWSLANNPTFQGKYTTTEAYVILSYSPGQTYINQKMKRRPINKDAPVFKLKHAIGLKGFLGGQYNYNFTEVAAIKRFWVGTWGKTDIVLKAGYQWNKVPFMMLIAPPANLSVIWQPQTFALLDNMEFLNDKYVSAQIEWDFCGKLFNRLPLIKKLQWRELVGFNVLYGGLSDKNNPMLDINKNSDYLMMFPEETHSMNGKPYVEMRVGIHNIFKLLSVEYVRRLTHTSSTKSSKNHGVRFGFRVTF